MNTDINTRELSELKWNSTYGDSFLTYKVGNHYFYLTKYNTNAVFLETYYGPWLFGNKNKLTIFCTILASEWLMDVFS